MRSRPDTLALRATLVALLRAAKHLARPSSPPKVGLDA